MAFAPIVHLAQSLGGGIDEVGAHGGFHQAPIGDGILLESGPFHFQFGGEQGGIEDLKLGAGTAAPYPLAGVFLQSGQHAGGAEQIQIMRERGGITRILELAEQLVVGEYLPGILAAEREQAAQQSRLAHRLQQQDVAGERGLDQGFADIVAPADFVSDEWCRTRITAEEQEFLETEAKGRLHFRKAPVRQVEHFEASGQALRQSSLYQQGCRSQQHHLERYAVARVLVPQAFHRFRPAGGLLDLVDHQHGATFTGREARALPLLCQPAGPPQRRFIRARIHRRVFELLHDREHQGGLAHLPGTGHYLDEAAWLVQALAKNGCMRPLIEKFAHRIEHFFSLY